MKKLLMLALTFVLCACSGATVTEGKSDYVFTDKNGNEQKVIVSVKLKDGKISKIEIDETYTVDGKQTTKRTLGNDYAMKETSSKMGKIEGGAEWFEQVDHLQEVLVGTEGTIALDNTGYPTDEEILAGCTINLGTIAEAIEDAISKAE